MKDLHNHKNTISRYFMTEKSIKRRYLLYFLFTAAFLLIAAAFPAAVFADTVPRLSDRRFSRELSEMTEEYGRSVTRKQAAANPYINSRLILKSYDGTLDPEEYGAVDAIRDRDGHYILQFNSSLAARRAEAKLKKDDATIYVEPDYPVFLQEDEADYLLNTQGDETDNILNTQDGGAVDQGNTSWGVGYTGCDAFANTLKDKTNLVKVAVIDTGVRSTHELFAGGKIFKFGNDDSSDTFGHGTMVAGVIAQCTRELNKIQIIPAAVLKKDADGKASGTTADVGNKISELSGKTNGTNIYHCNAQVINLSLVAEARSSSTYMTEVIKNAVNAGSVVVVSAGNQRDNAIYHTPADIKDSDAEGVIVVSGCNSSGGLYDNSNYGESVDVCAPGYQIKSASYSGDNLYSIQNGTSFSAPFVSAAAAMLLLEDSSRTPSVVEKLIKRKVMSFAAAPERYYGTGILKLNTADESSSYVQQVIDSVNKIPANLTLSEADKNSVLSARKKFNVLTTEEAARLSEYNERIKAAENRIKELEAKKKAEEKKALDLYFEIDSLPEKITLSDKSKVAELRRRYNALNAEQREIIFNLDTLVNAEKMILALEKQEAERKAKEEAERKAQEAAKAEAERKAQEAAEAERKAREAAEAERKAREAAEAERKAQEEAYKNSDPHANISYQVPLKKKQKTGRLQVLGLAGGDSVVSWASSDSKRATVSGSADGTCVVKAGRKTGKAVIIAKTESGKEVTFRIKVQKNKVKTKKILIGSKTVMVSVGERVILNPELYPITSADKIKYTSGNKKIVKVSKSGVLTARSAGSAVITIKSGSKKLKVKVIVQ